MHTLTVNTPSAQYPIFFRHSFDGLPDAFAETKLQNRKVCIVTDSHVAALYLDKVKQIITPAAAAVSAVFFTAGEHQKHLDTIVHLYRFFMEQQLDRSSVVVALGGGVVGDVAGFAAATYMRGLPFVQLPTTLLAQVDSGVGGKTGVDLGGVKNLIGAFYQPRFVYTNLQTLATLPFAERQSGMGEVLKHALIGDPTYYAYMQAHKAAVKALDRDAMVQTVVGSCRIKAAVVAADEKEQGRREILNFGHTFGHAVESLSGYALPHGCCVSIGMCAALRLSLRMGHITPDEEASALTLLRYFDLPVKAPPDIPPEMIFQNMFTDKKVKNQRLRLVLLRGLGNAYTENNAAATDIMEAVKHIAGGVAERGQSV